MLISNLTSIGMVMTQSTPTSTGKVSITALRSPELESRMLRLTKQSLIKFMQKTQEPIFLTANAHQNSTIKSSIKLIMAIQFKSSMYEPIKLQLIKLT